MENQQKLSLGELEQLLQTIDLEDREKTEPEKNYSPYIDAAAVLLYFDISEIKPFGSVSNEKEKNEKLFELMSLCQSVIFPGDIRQEKGESVYNYKYSLRDEMRKETLKALRKRNEISGALEVNHSIAFASDNKFQSIFTSCLRDIPVELEELELEELTALHRISTWLTVETGFPLMPVTEQIERRIQVAEIMSSFRHLLGTWANGRYEEQFRGRDEELYILRQYVGVAPPQGSIEYLARGFNIIKEQFVNTRKPALLIHGLGGVGKSTLIAKFIMEHFEAHEKDRFPFVYLDFDRPTLNPAEPDTLLIEAARQLAIQYADHYSFSENAKAFYEQWKGQFANLGGQINSVNVSIKSELSITQLQDDRKKLRSSFYSLLNSLKEFQSRPFLIVLDTFEEVQCKGEPMIMEVYELVLELRSHYSNIRAIVAGRAPVTQLDTEKLELGDLDIKAATAFLARTGMIDEAMAGNIARRIGGNPLTLKLALNVVNDIGLKKFNEIKTTQKKFGFLEKKLPQVEIQGILYDRILNHIHDKQIYKLAHPGLVLRVLSPDIIQEILAGPCNLNVSNSEEAHELFVKMRNEVSLVTEVDSNTVRHRPDVRRVMLKFIERSERQLVKQIRYNAVRYYSKLSGVVARAEEIYHRLALGQPRKYIDDRWMEGVEDYLLNSVEELPDKSQAYLSARTGFELVNSSVWDKADLEDKERRLTRRVVDFLNAGHAEKALEILKAESTSQFNGVIAMLNVKALIGTGEIQTALSLAKKMLTENNKDLTRPVRKELKRYVSELDTIPERFFKIKNVGHKGFNKIPFVQNMKMKKNESNDDFSVEL